MKPLQGRCAIVTGASAGIGLATAIRLATAGADLVVNARDSARLDQAVDRIPQQPGPCRWRRRGRCGSGGHRRTDGHRPTMGRGVDSGGQCGRRPSARSGHRAGCRNAVAQQRLEHAGTDHGRRPGYGSARLGTHRHRVQPCRPLLQPTSTSTYAAAKAGVIALTRCAAIDLAPHGVTVNSVAPRVTTTDRIVNRLAGMPESQVAAIEAQIPRTLGRTGRSCRRDRLSVFPGCGCITGHPGRQRRGMDELKATAGQAGKYPRWDSEPTLPP